MYNDTRHVALIHYIIVCYFSGINEEYCNFKNATFIFVKTKNRENPGLLQINTLAFYPFNLLNLQFDQKMTKNDQKTYVL